MHRLYFQKVADLIPAPTPFPPQNFKLFFFFPCTGNRFEKDGFPCTLCVCRMNPLSRQCHEYMNSFCITLFSCFTPHYKSWVVRNLKGEKAMLLFLVNILEAFF